MGPPQEEAGSDVTNISKELLEPEEQGGGSGLLVSDETIGEGDELVYIHYQVSERKWAELEGGNVWRCKIGFTAGDLTARILGQFPATGMGRLPVVDLAIRTDDGRGLERAIHFALDQVARATEFGSGTGVP